MLPEPQSGFCWACTNSFSTSCWILYNSGLHWQLLVHISAHVAPFLRRRTWKHLCEVFWYSANCHQSEGSQLDCEAQLWGFPSPGQAPAPLYLWPPLLPVAWAASIGQFDRPVRSKELQVCHFKCFFKGAFNFFYSFVGVLRWSMFIFTIYKDIIGKV